MTILLASSSNIFKARYTCVSFMEFVKACHSLIKPVHNWNNNSHLMARDEMKRKK